MIKDYSGANDPRHALMDEDGEALADGYAGLAPDARGKPPTEEELQHPVVAPGEPHFLDIGVRYQGEWRVHADGLAKAIREQAQALSMYLPVALEHLHVGAFLMNDLHPDVSREVGYMSELMFKSTAVAIRQCVFQSSDYLRKVILPASGRITDAETKERIFKSTIVYTSWERDRVDSALIEVLRGVGELWLPCDDNVKAFMASGMPPERIYVMSHTYNPATHLPTQIAWPRGSEVVPEGRRFYNIGKWEPRKNQHGLIGAFLHAFTPKDRVSLLIKTHGWGYWDDYPPPEESLEMWVQDERVIANGWTPQNIQRVLRIMVDKITDAEIAELHKQSNIYVTASHGEAWDMPAFDALCAGNSLVHVGYGGTRDYADLVTQFCTVTEVPFTMGPTHAGYFWEPGAQWANYEHADLVAALKQAKAPVRRVHPPRFDRFSRVNVGYEMMQRVLGRAKEVGGDEAVAALRMAGSFG
jgi:glycosyltransferase involved in cell wall biosynthesis